METPKVLVASYTPGPKQQIHGLRIRIDWDNCPEVKVSRRGAEGKTVTAVEFSGQFVYLFDNPESITQVFVYATQVYKPKWLYAYYKYMKPLPVGDEPRFDYKIGLRDGLLEIFRADLRGLIEHLSEFCSDQLDKAQEEMDDLIRDLYNIRKATLDESVIMLEETVEDQMVWDCNQCSLLEGGNGRQDARLVLQYEFPDRKFSDPPDFDPYELSRDRMRNELMRQEEEEAKSSSI